MSHAGFRYPLVALAIIGATGLGAAQVQSAESELRSYLERFTGNAAADCGVHHFVPFAPNQRTAAKTAMQSSLGCVVTKAKNRQSSWSYNQHQGVDSWIARGVLGTAAGAMYQFAYDSAPCGGPVCRGQFTIQLCERPVVAVGPSGIVSFECSPRKSLGQP